MAVRPDNGLLIGDDGLARCWWHGGLPDYLRYHDEEWGQPMTDDRRLFEKICLEGFQAGLSWLTILRKRENFRAAFDGFDFERVANYDAVDVERLVKNAGIIRHRQKIESTVNNARRALEMRAEFGSLASYFWGFEPKPNFARFGLALTCSQYSRAVRFEVSITGMRVLLERGSR